MKNIYHIIFICVAVLCMVSCGEDNPSVEASYIITFDSDGGTAVSSQTIKAGKTAVSPTDPSKEGYTFLYWCVAGTTTTYNFQTPVNGNITLVAQWTKEEGLADIATEIGKDANFSLFAAALANMTGTSGEYTIFALPDSIIRYDTDVFPVSDIQWHVVNGRFDAEALLQAQTLQTVGGETLSVVCETVEIEGEEHTFLYINDVPVNYQSIQLMGSSAVYSIGSNIAQISAKPGMDDLDAYNGWVALAMEGTWIIERVENRKYYVWSFSGREEVPFESTLNRTHIGCILEFERDPQKISDGCAGTYETGHVCGDVNLSFSGNGFLPENGWWSVGNGRIEFYMEIMSGTRLWLQDSFSITNGIGTTIKSGYGMGGDGYYGGDEDVIFDIYYEIEYTLRKIPTLR